MGAERMFLGGWSIGRRGRRVRVAAARLRQPAADHVADRQQRHVEPDLVGSEVVGAAFLALDCVAGDQ